MELYECYLPMIFHYGSMRTWSHLCKCMFTLRTLKKRVQKRPIFIWWLRHDTRYQRSFCTGLSVVSILISGHYFTTKFLKVFLHTLEIPKHQGFNGMESLIMLALGHLTNFGWSDHGRPTQKNWRKLHLVNIWLPLDDLAWHAFVVLPLCWHNDAHEGNPFNLIGIMTACNWIISAVSWNLSVVTFWSPCKYVMFNVACQH